MSAAIQLLSAISGNVDPYLNNVVFLMHANEANNSTTLVNSGTYSNLTSNLTGGFKLSTVQAKFGSASLYNDSSGGHAWFSSFQTGQPFDGDFTFEGWVYWAASPSGYRGIIGFSHNTHDHLFLGRNGNYLELWPGSGSGGSNKVGVTVVTNTQWHHWALTRVGTTVYGWHNGILQFSTTLNGTVGEVGQGFYIGAYKDGTYDMYGYMDEYRFTKGVARYTEPFTPPTSAFPNP